MIRNKKICPKCGKEFSLSNYTRHVASCKGGNIIKTPPKRYDWSVLQKEYDNGLSYRDLEFKYGVTANSIIAAQKRGVFTPRSRSEAGVLRNKRYGPNIMSDEAKERVSKWMSENNPGGKSKWYEVNGIKVQGTWERDFAHLLTEQNIKWQRGKPIPYIISDNKKHYTPDFYLPEYNVYIEIKGHWWGNDREKMDCVIEQHPDKRIIIIENKDFSAALALQVKASG